MEKSRQYKRTDRLGELIKKEMWDLIVREIKDPRIGFISITDVILSKDMRQAKVYVSIYGKEEEKKESFKGLNSASGFIQAELGRRLRLRYAPKLNFFLDSSIEQGSHICNLLNGLSKDD